MRKRRRLIFTAILAAALLVRLVAIYEYGPSVIKFGDAPDYLSAAARVCSAGSYPDGSSMPFFRAPGLPFFIAATTFCHPEAIWLVKIALAVVDTISVAMVFLLAEELFHDRRLSLLAMAGAAIYPYFIAQVCDVRTEGLFMMLFTASIGMALRAIRRPALPPAILAGVCAGAAALVRPVALLLLVLLPAAFFYLASFRVKRTAAFAAGAILCLGPWIVRNEIRFHELIFVNDAGGYNFWRGTSPEIARVESLSDAREFSNASIRFETITSPAIAREVDGAAGTPLGRSREWYRRAWNNFAENPGAFCVRLIRNAWAYWRPWLSTQAHSRTVTAASGLLMIPLDVLAFLGWTLLRRRDRRLALWCAAGALSFWILQTPFQVVSRFRIPITDPFLIVFAAASVMALLRAKPGESHRTGRPICHAGPSAIV